MKMSKAFENTTTFDQVIEIINAAKDMTAEELAGQKVYKTATTGGYVYSTTGLRLMLEFLAERGAIFDISAALNHAEALREHFKPPMGPMLSRYNELKARRAHLM